MTADRPLMGGTGVLHRETEPAREWRRCTRHS
jgi:hypothetical protein